MDKYQLLKKKWLDKVALKVSGDEAKEIINILLRMLSDLFDYVETEDEMRLTLKHFKRYYTKVKSQLKSDYTQQGIEAIALSVETHFKYICNVFKGFNTARKLHDVWLQAETVLLSQTPRNLNIPHAMNFRVLDWNVDLCSQQA